MGQALPHARYELLVGLVVVVMTLLGAAALARTLGVSVALHDVSAASPVERLVWLAGALTTTTLSATTWLVTRADEAAVEKTHEPCAQRTMRRVAALCLSIACVETSALVFALVEAISLVDALVVVATLRPLLLVVYATATPVYRATRRSDDDAAPHTQ